MILDEIVADKKIRLNEHKKHMDLQTVRRLAEEKQKEDELTADKRSFFNNLKKEGISHTISIIGEFKKASPSLGTITSKVSLDTRIADYSASVDAISCLTEEDHFHGCVDDFRVQIAWIN